MTCQKPLPGHHDVVFLQRSFSFITGVGHWPGHLQIESKGNLHLTCYCLTRISSWFYEIIAKIVRKAGLRHIPSFITFAGNRFKIKDPRNYWYVLITAQTNSHGKGPLVIHSETLTQMTHDVPKNPAWASRCCIFITFVFVHYWSRALTRTPANRIQRQFTLDMLLPDTDFIPILWNTSKNSEKSRVTAHTSFYHIC